MLEPRETINGQRTLHGSYFAILSVDWRSQIIVVGFLL